VLPHLQRGPGVIEASPGSFPGTSLIRREGKRREEKRRDVRSGVSPAPERSGNESDPLNERRRGVRPGDDRRRPPKADETENLQRPVAAATRTGPLRQAFRVAHERETWRRFPDSPGAHTRVYRPPARSMNEPVV
jgi:hypothetical protein